MSALINPTTEEPIPTPPPHSSPQVEAILQGAQQAFASWRGTSMNQRSDVLKGAGALLRSRSGDLATTMAVEMGKPVTQGRQEVEKCAWTCDYFADHAAAMLAPEMIHADAARSYVRFDPLGPVLAIMPWNFPFWQVFRFAAPALMAGNVAVLKHAPNVPTCALAIEQLMVDAGFPKGVFSNLYIPNEAAEAVIKSPHIAAVTLTGSPRAGRAVASEAGSVLKKVVLELGGSDPFIVLGDADVQKVAATAVDARCINSGQSCIAAKRFIIERSIAPRFTEAMVAAMANKVLGDPLDEKTQIGPMARLDLLEGLHAQVQRSISAGAKLLCGGNRLPRKGFFYAPTVLAEVKPGMAAFDEETFGPVAAITPFDHIAQAVRLANQSSYGLGASIWTKDINRAETMTGEIESGCVFINGIVKSDARLPFGGVKESGFGRELSAIGIREFVNAKTVWVGT